MTEDPFHLRKPNEVELAKGLCYQVEVLKIEITVGQQRPWGYSTDSLEGSSRADAGKEA